jgi:hypothetical protein
VTSIPLCILLLSGDRQPISWCSNCTEHKYNMRLLPGRSVTTGCPSVDPALLSVPDGAGTGLAEGSHASERYLGLGQV